ncbi:MAG: hypothetical protein ACYT04_37460 [Nostoc sp.]
MERKLGHPLLEGKAGQPVQRIDKYTPDFHAYHLRSHLSISCGRMRSWKMPYPSVLLYHFISHPQLVANFLIVMDKSRIKTCDECSSLYYQETLKMSSLCPQCSHVLYAIPLPK